MSRKTLLATLASIVALAASLLVLNGNAQGRTTTVHYATTHIGSEESNYVYIDMFNPTAGTVHATTQLVGAAGQGWTDISDQSSTMAPHTPGGASYQCPPAAGRCDADALLITVSSPKVVISVRYIDASLGTSASHLIDIEPGDLKRI